MRWQKGMRSLRRGLRLASRVASARLAELAVPAPSPPRPPQPGRFVALPDPAPNPGRLRGLVYRPPGPSRPGAPLIVLLHGCGQDAATFGVNAGWTGLADRLGIPLLLPEQMEANNRQRCFQWFQPSEIERDRGEAGSIAAMVRLAIARFGSDPGQVFIAGMSAGGAMTAAMLAAYPELFAAGAVVAGLPVGAASGTLSALTSMARGGPSLDAEGWATLARRVAPVGYVGRWPRLSVWHGTADDTVAPANGAQLAAQFAALHGLAEAAARPGAQHQRWGDAVELWRLPGLGHAWPVEAGSGRPAEFTAASSVPAVPMIARFWGLPPASALAAA
jgi:feruloyl esterase